MGRVEGKVAIVTGAARGTGEATARLLAREGARVVVADILEERAQLVAKEIGSAVCFERLDVTSEEDWQRVIGATDAREGEIDVELAASFQQRILATQKSRPLAEKIGDVANMILFLASDESASCTGTDFLVDGGNLAGTRIKGAPGA